MQLAPSDHLFGRGDDCDLRPRGDAPGISRLHARLHWKGTGFEISDQTSTHGTWLNGQRLAAGEAHPLSDGDRLRLGEREWLYRDEARPAPDVSVERLLGLIREMTSLDPATLVPRALELLRLVSGTETAHLVNAGTDPYLKDLLTPIDDPSLQVSRSNIHKALTTKETISWSTQDDAAVDLSQSASALGLRRLWVKPLAGRDGRPVAAVYLDSRLDIGGAGPGPDALMHGIADQIALALRNASLHAEVVALKHDLEKKVVERTRQLEESQALLVSQDRLATLGRLVAAIAHELNNPVGAISSFAQTLSGLVEPTLHLESELQFMLPAAEEAAVARALLHSACQAASRIPLDSRRRRELENEMTRWLEEEQVPSAETISRRLARAGLERQATEPALALMRTHGEELSRLVERVHTFARGAETIRECAANVARIVDGLKTYAHLDRAAFETLDIHQSIQATLSVLASRIPKGVAVETRFDDIEPFPHRPGELTQVWTNLVDNALRAMGDSGTLKVETRDLGDAVRIAVADTGTGVPDRLRDRIFDLDVTSRGPGAGLGLGLPICRSIVEQHHGGRISFESRPGHTVFTVVLPKQPPIQEGSS